MSNFSDAIGGLKTVLQNSAGLRNVANHPANVANEFPTAVLLAESFDPRFALQGNTFEGRIRAVVLVSSGDGEDAFAQLYDHIDPTTANKSVTKAVIDGPTLNGKVDTAWVELIENIGRRELWGGFYVGFDAVVGFIKTVA